MHFDPASTVVDALPQVYRTDSTTEGRAWSTDVLLDGSATLEVLHL